MSGYHEFIAGKAIIDPPTGLSTVPALPSCLFAFQSDIVRWALRRGRAALFAGTGLGKALRVDWPVATPHGWRAIGSLSPGDMVFGADGKPHRVLGVYPQGTRAMFRVVFSDGAETVCDADHLWAVNTRGRRSRGLPWRVLSLREIMAEGLSDQQGRRHFIPVAAPAQYPQASLPIDPYTLGVILGDGAISQITVSLTTDSEILDRIQLPEGVSVSARKKVSGHVSTAALTGPGRGKNNPIIAALRKMGLHGKRSDEKAIPEPYKLASIEQRRALLQGLLDTDGHVRADGDIEFGSTSEALAIDVQEVIRSLGGCAAIRLKSAPRYRHNGESRRGRPYYRMSVQLPGDWNPFRLSRKAEAWRPRVKYQPLRAIASIEPAGEAEAVCIAVDAADHLFVAADYVVTHNTLMALAWAKAIHDATGHDVLILTPLAVAAQFVREGQKFGIAVKQCRTGADVEPGITVTNYEKLPHFELARFGGIVLDESSILKAHDGKTRAALIEACQPIPFRLAATATPAPNDFMELGNHAEFLGVLSYTDMLATFFSHDGGETQKWRLKGHAEGAFWRWMCSWSVMLRHPADLGYEAAGFDLPPLNQQQHTVRGPDGPSEGALFAFEARTMQERLAARRSSVGERVALAASITPQDRPFVWWCNLNSESEGLTRSIPGAVEVRGSDPASEKERKLIDFSEGRCRVLVTKPSICGHGMNWQHCADTGFVGLSDSFEQVYQAIRRFWRFGQTEPVNVHFIAAETEGAVVANLRRKEADAERMAKAMIQHMADLSSAAVRGATRDRPDYNPTKPIMRPEWLREEAA